MAAALPCWIEGRGKVAVVGQLLLGLESQLLVAQERRDPGPHTASSPTHPAHTFLYVGCDQVAQESHWEW